MRDESISRGGYLWCGRCGFYLHVRLAFVLGGQMTLDDQLKEFWRQDEALEKDYLDRSYLEENQELSVKIIRKQERIIKVMREALEELEIDHTHLQEEKHMRPLGETYGYCSICCCTENFTFGGVANEALAEVDRLERE